MTDASPALPDSAMERKTWMTILATARLDDIEAGWAGVPCPEFIWIRKPEQGAAMLRGRAGGTGRQFNVGEVTLVRCALRLGSGEIGIAYVMGRSKRHAALAALFDALLQRDGPDRAALLARVEAIGSTVAARRRQVTAEALTSKVEFFMKRDGKDED